MNVKGHSKQHRTVVVIDFTNGDSEFSERAGRLVQSLNGKNIKADIVSVHDGQAVAGFQPSYVDNVPALGDADITAWAADQGYSQVITSRPAVSNDDEDEDEDY